MGITAIPDMACHFTPCGAPIILQLKDKPTFPNVKPMLFDELAPRVISLATVRPLPSVPNGTDRSHCAGKFLRLDALAAPDALPHRANSKAIGGKADLSGEIAARRRRWLLSGKAAVAADMLDCL